MPKYPILWESFVVARERGLAFRECPFCGDEVWDEDNEKSNQLPIGFLTHLYVESPQHKSNKKWVKWQEHLKDLDSLK